jgi:signal transduction histidine kinase
MPLTTAQQEEVIQQGHAVVRYQAGGITYMLGCARFNEFEGDVKSIYGLGFPIEPALARSGKMVSLVKKSQTTMTMAMAAIAALTVVGLIVVSLVLARRITAPIEKMTNNLACLAQDDIEAPLPSRIDTAELQKLADSMAAFRESISKRLEVEKRFRGTIEVLEIAKLKAESSERLKSEFLSTMSHELRTPLNAITVFSKLIAEVLRDDPKKSEWVQLIIDNSDHLMRLVEDMLDVAASSDGRLGLNEAPQNIRTVIRLACVQVMPDAKKKKISITDACDPDLPMVYADGERLRKVFFLIIENSVKFCRPEGRVEIDAFVGDDGGVSVSIADTGIGMDPMTLASAFSAFKQADGSNTREYGGLGIGLTLCRALVERHGGTIEIDSDAGLGTIVTIHLPAERSIEKG